MKIDERILIGNLNKMRIKSYQEKHGLSNDVVEEAKKEEPAPTQENIFTSEDQTQEREIVYFLLNYGDKEITEVEKQGRDEIVHRYSVADFIISELENEDTFQNQTYEKVYHIFRDAVNRNQLPDIRSLVSHEDSEVRTTCIDLISKKDVVSPNWEKREKIIVKDETTNLRRSCEKVVYSFKFRLVNDIIAQLRERIKDNPDDVEDIMAEIIHYESIRQEIARLLGGRIALK